MLHTYLGAEDNPLNAAIGRKFMCAVVRRTKRPGCKFDQQLVLQSGQGVRKSTFCEDVAVAPDLFTDAGDLSADIKQQMEIGQGKQSSSFRSMLVLAGPLATGTRHRSVARLTGPAWLMRTMQPTYRANGWLSPP